MSSLPIMGQRDPRWAALKIGYGDGTVGQYGCLFSSLAMLAFHDQPIVVSTSVAALMDAMKGNGNYTPEGGNYLQSADIGAITAGSVKFVKASDLFPGPVDAKSMYELNSFLAADVNNYAIIEVDNRGDNLTPDPHAAHQHFVVMLDATGAIHDPWYGDKATITRYGSTPAKAIWRYILYSITQPPATYTVTRDGVAIGTFTTTETGAAPAPATYGITRGGVSLGFIRVIAPLPAPVPLPLPTPPPPQPKSQPPAVTTPALGGNMIGNARDLEQAYGYGLRCFTALSQQQALIDFKRRHPDAICMHREYIADWKLTGQQVADRIGGGPNGLIYLCYNEEDEFGVGDEAALTARVNYELDFARAMRAKGAACAVGTWSVGCPDITKDWVCNQLKRLAVVYNADPGVYVDMHLYSPNRQHIYGDSDLQWYESRWRYLFTKCGFDPKAGAKVVCSETGLDEGGIGGFMAHGENVDDFAMWCNRWQQIQGQPIVTVDGAFPSPFLGASIFGCTNGMDSHWAGYDVYGYLAGAQGKVRYA